ncbi:uncharacterized protein LOC103853946 isoform X2 [Brassica rapa]|uniref:uncharacterized protein LOC103853946 isoform X2 n=1 Tax=Brassica campestris TaxID=3711 RepID=UPI000872A5D1|nr:uncharacterized protein LOC103853946 isoform X2 [Brassica rapa]
MFLFSFLKNVDQFMFFSTHEEVMCNGHNFQIKLELIALFLQLRSLRILKTTEAGLMSGSPGIESIPGPELPKLEFVDRFNAKNQKFYAENDSRFKESPILKKLLENSKLNKEKNEKAIQDKYCLRGAEWGVGDCSTNGMTDEEKEQFITMLKKKTGLE